MNESYAENLTAPPMARPDETPAQRNLRHFATYQFEVAVAKKFELVDQFMAPIVTMHAVPSSGINALLGWPAPALPTQVPNTNVKRDPMAAIANHRRVIEEICASGDHVVARWRISGNLVGNLAGFKGQGQLISFAEIGFIKFDPDGRITDMWLSVDGTELLRELGVKAEDITIKPELRVEGASAPAE